MKINKKGFTLIELLVVIAIIGLLSTLAVISLNNARQKSRDARRLSDVKQMQTALELYYTDMNGYPSTVSGSTAGMSICGTGAGIVASGGCGTAAVYMNLIPGNPAPVDNTVSGCGGSYYTYTSADSTTYTIQYCLGGLTNGISNTIVHYATPAGLTNP